MIGITQPHPMAEAIPTRIKKMSRGEANAKTLGGEKIKKKEDGRQVQKEDGREKANVKTLGGEKMEGKFKNKINKKKMEEERQM